MTIHFEKNKQTEKNAKKNKTANSLAPKELDGCHSNCQNLLCEKTKNKYAIGISNLIVRV